jgi:predicted transcriptional regulator YdeE
MKLFSIFIIFCLKFLVGCSSISKNEYQNLSEILGAPNKCLDKLKIVGVSVQTTNQNSQSLTDVERLWKHFWASNISAQVTNKISNDIYAVYTDYDKGSLGQFTVLIGFPVNSFSNLPATLTVKEVTAGRCKKFISKGKMPDAIIKTWNQIWQDKELDRAYRTDFTIHGEKYYDGENAEVETYISVK